MLDLFDKLLIICPLVFLAGFIDSIAGGGGLISLPSYTFVGVSQVLALGTNKFASTFGTIFSTLRFIKNGQINYKSALISVITALIGSYIGAMLAMTIDEKYLKYFMMVMLPAVGVFIIHKRDFGEIDTSLRLSNTKMIVLSALSGLVIGAYDGFFGPGTGTFLILIYTGIMGFNLITASGNAKIVNLASNIAALATFIAGGKVIFILGIPAAICSIFGNWLGSGLAIKNGAKVIKPVFIGVLALLLVKMSSDLF